MKIEEIRDSPLTPDKSKNSNLPVFAYPTFVEGEKVRLLKKYSKGNEDIKDKIFTVRKLYKKDLGDMIVYIVKFQETGESPYLAHYFTAIT